MSTYAIGKRLKKARIDAELTQNDVAKLLGISYQAISNYERGINRIDTDTLTRLCNIYEIQIGDLLRTPAWDDEMFEAYRQAKTDEQRQYYIQLWGCPAELIDEENERREPSSPSLSPEDAELLQKFHAIDKRGQEIVLCVLNHEFDTQQDNGGIHTLKMVARDGRKEERHLTEDEAAQLKARYEQARKVPEDL